MRWTAAPDSSWIENYEKGFKYDRYELTILEVHNRYVTVGLLTQLSMEFAPTDDNGGTPYPERREYDDRS